MMKLLVFDTATGLFSGPLNYDCTVDRTWLYGEKSKAANQPLRNTDKIIRGSQEDFDLAANKVRQLWQENFDRVMKERDEYFSKYGA